MDPKAVKAALPWARRAWKVMPFQARVVALLVAAAGGIAYSIEGTRELRELEARRQPPAGG